jgi:hypothetical protein
MPSIKENLLVGLAQHCRLHRGEIPTVNRRQMACQIYRDAINPDQRAALYRVLDALSHSKVVVAESALKKALAECAEAGLLEETAHAFPVYEYTFTPVGLIVARYLNQNDAEREPLEELN